MDSNSSKRLLTTFEEAVMRKFLVTAVFTFVTVAMRAPPVLAQAPAPKVTITGLFDQVTSASSNVQDGSFGRTSDKEWYATTRFRPDIVFEVGRTKAVLGLEIDLTYGAVNACGGGPGKNVGAAAASEAGCQANHAGDTSSAGLNTDVTGVIEIKWAYTEFDLTGKDSFLPMIPVPTVARARLQPFVGLANYKVAYANGDFAGVSAVTTFAPNLRTNIAYVMVEDEIAGADRGAAGAKITRGNDFAIIISPEYTVFKGLDVKPLYSFFYAEGATSGNARRGAADVHIVGGTTSGAGPCGNVTNPNGSPAFHENRHTFGADASWRMGPWGLAPTVYYQWGTRDVLGLTATSGANGQRVETKMSSWLFDAIGSYQLGPLLLEARGVYSTGNKARDNLSRKIYYFEPLDLDTSYDVNWPSILAFDWSGAYLAAGKALDTSELLNNVLVKRKADDGYLTSARLRLSF